MSHSSYTSSSQTEEDQEILQPFAYLLRISGRKVRSKFCDALNTWLNIPEDKLTQIKFIVEALHNASLLLDDIQDFSVFRRSALTAHTVFGLLRTVISANYVSNVVIEKTIELGDFRALEILARKSLDLYTGQGMEIYWRDESVCPTLEQYKLMCIRKTGGLFLLCVELMQVFSDVKVDFIKLVSLVGLFFQIRDDYMNLCSDEYAEKKTFCEDLSEGKFSFPVIHAIQKHPEDCRIKNLVKQRPTDLDTKKYFLKLLHQFGSLEYTRDVLKALKEELLQEIEGLPENSELVHLLTVFLKFDL